MKERFHLEKWREFMNKLEQMKIMSSRIYEKCEATNCECEKCPLMNTTENFCYSYKDEEQYDEVKHHCILMNIDISDIIDEPKEIKETNNEFIKNDIEPGYILQLKEGNFVIAMGEKSNLFFYYFDVDKKQLNNYAFSLSDIREDFTALCDIAIIAIYGHTFSKTLDLSDRLILWERKGNECKIYDVETDSQSIKIQPNANTYLSNDSDGDIWIKNISDKDECIAIHRENLPGLIAALQEIQGLYEKCGGIK